MPPPRSPPRGPAWGPRAGPPWGAPTAPPADPRGPPHGGLVGGRLKGGGMANPRGGGRGQGGGRCSERSGNTFRRSGCSERSVYLASLGYCPLRTHRFGESSLLRNQLLWRDRGALAFWEVSRSFKRKHKPEGKKEGIPSTRTHTHLRSRPKALASAIPRLHCAHPRPCNSTFLLPNVSQ